MRLASDEITIRVSDATVRLRPTLRAALRLERRYGGFEAIVRAIADGNLTVIADVIRETSTRLSDIPDILETVGLMPLRIGLECLTEPLIQHVFALAGFDKENAEESDRQPSGKPMSFAEYHEKLFGIATGWLGWSPETAWDATPSEIIVAYQGKLDMLKAVFGSSKEAEPEQAAEPTFERDRASWSALKLSALAGGNRAS
jgi:hypothetical protein